MKLESVSLFGVGRHDGVVIDGLGNGLTVVYGRNEAGKSTILAGLRGVLFGRAVTAEQPTVLEKGAAGRLMVTASDGTVYAIERTLHRKSPPKLVRPDGQVLVGEAALKDCIAELGQVEDTVFQSVFTFQLAELKDFADTDKTLQSRIYTTGMFGSQSPIEVETRFAALAKNIFNPDKRARNATLIQCLQKLDEVQAAWLAKRDTPQAYRDLQARVAERQSAYTEIQQHLKDAEAHSQELQKLTEALPLHRETIVLREALVQHALIAGVTEQECTAMQALTGQTAASEQAVAVAQQRIDSLQAEFAQIEVSDAYLHRLPTIRSLQAAASGVVEQQKQLDALVREVAALDEQIRDWRGQLSAGWTAEQIDGIDLGLGVVDQVRAFETRLQQVDRECATVAQTLEAQAQTNSERQRLCEQWAGTADLTHAQEALRARLAQVSSERDALADDENGVQTLEALLRDLASTEAEFAGLQATVKQAEALSDQQKPGNRQWATALTVVAAALLGLTIWMAVLLQWGPAGLSLAAALAVVWATRAVPVESRRGVSPQLLELQRQLQTRERVRESLQAQITQVLAALTTVRPPERLTLPLDSLRADLRSAHRALDEKWSVVQEQRQSYSAWQDATTAYRQTAARLERWNAERDAAVADWQAFLRRLAGLEFVLSPVAFLQELNSVRQIRLAAAAAARKRESIAGLAEAISAYLHDIAAVVSETTVESPEIPEVASALDGRRPNAPTAYDVTTAVERLRVLFDTVIKHEQGQAERTRLERQIDDATKELAKQQQRLDASRGERDALYTRAGVGSAAEFPAFVQAYEEKTKVERALQERLYQLYGHFGGRARYEQRVPALDAATETALAEERERLEEDSARLRNEANVVLKEIGDLENRLKTWDDGPSAGELAWRLAALEEDKQRLAREWAVYTVASHLTRQAREAYERERQPQTLLTAGSLFAEITGGKYTGIVVRSDEQGNASLYCTDGAGRDWPAERLSRGTREQLYLALRLAVIEEYRGRGVRLPVVLDDPLVNFDTSRLEACLTVLSRFADDHQLIYLTCGRQVHEFATANSQVAVVELQ